MPVIGKVADAAYDLWSENRLRLTGRGELADVVKERAEKLRDAEEPTCDENGCGLVFGDEDDEIAQDNIGI